MTIPMVIAATAWACLSVGYLRRRHTKQHVSLVVTGFLLDIGLVLYLEVTRSAIATASSFELGLLPQLHILFSLLAALLYVPVFCLGVLLLTDPNRGGSVRLWHRKLALTTYWLRTLGFIFMFSL